MRIVAAVLAAGASRRLGRPKQLLPYEGGTLLGRVTERLCRSSCERVAVVLGARYDEIEPALASLPVAILRNPAWREGIASSIRCAVSWARAADGDALLLCVGDQPYITTAHIDALVAAFSEHGAAVASRYEGVLGVPALFDACWYPQLASLTGDRGARAVLATADVHAIDWPDGLVDVDEPYDVPLLQPLQ